MTLTKSQILSWDPSVLTAIGIAWTALGSKIEDLFTRYKAAVVAVNNGHWEGVTADAAVGRAGSDERAAVQVVEHLKRVAKIASDGFHEVNAPLQRARQAIADTIQAGYSVREDLSVYKDGKSTEADEKAMQKCADTIKAAATDTETADKHVRSALQAARGDLRVAFAGAHPATPPPAPRAPVLPDDPDEFNRAWNDLSPEEKDAEYQQDHFIGNHPGMPFEDRNHYNRLHLDELQHDNQAEIDRLRAEHPNWGDGQSPWLKGGDYALWKQQWDAANHTRDGYNAVRSKIESNEGVPRLLGFIDDQGHAAVSIGNPDTAQRNAVFVPGTGQDVAAFSGSDGKSMDMFRAALDADPTLTAKDVSVTTWMGYDRPMSLFEAASTGPARGGASSLDAFVDGMHASHAGLPAIDTVIGHSYGSTLVGAAGSDGHHLAVDNVIAVGSPGMLVDHASELSLDPGASVYATRARFDPINAATGWTLGTNPTNDGFGATTFEAAPGPTTGPRILAIPSIAAHSSYWDEGNPALANMGAIIAGMPPPKVVP